jgi:hypothetical protein
LGLAYSAATEVNPKFEQRRFSLCAQNNEFSERPNQFGIEHINHVCWRFVCHVRLLSQSSSASRFTAAQAGKPVGRAAER